MTAKIIYLADHRKVKVKQLVSMREAAKKVIAELKVLVRAQYPAMTDAEVRAHIMDILTKRRQP